MCIIVDFGCADGSYCGGCFLFDPKYLFFIASQKIRYIFIPYLIHHFIACLLLITALIVIFFYPTLFVDEFVHAYRFNNDYSELLITYKIVIFLMLGELWYYLQWNSFYIRSLYCRSLRLFRLFYVNRLQLHGSNSGRWINKYSARAHRIVFGTPKELNWWVYLEENRFIDIKKIEKIYF